MNLMVERVEVWAASNDDNTGCLASILSGLREAGADLNGLDSAEDAEKAIAVLQQV